MPGRPVICPFCGQPVDKPRDLGFQTSDFDAGICECGAVYVSDVTGFNQGAAFVEALTLACGGDWDLAWELSPEEDYKEVVLEGYDQREHCLYSERERRELGIRGVLYFLKLADEIRDISLEQLKELRNQRTHAPRPPEEIKPRRLNRREAEKLIQTGQEKELLLLCQHQPVNLRILQKVLYSADPLLRWQTVMLLGQAAQMLLEDHPEMIADLVKRLIYASADSAASAWGALETVGEIIRHAPNRFGLFVRNLFAFLKYPEFRPGTLWALGRIGEKHPQLIRRLSVFPLLKLLEDEDPTVRGMAAWAVGRIGLVEGEKALQALLEDRTPLSMYSPEEKSLVEITVADLAKEALQRLEKE